MKTDLKQKKRLQTIFNAIKRNYEASPRIFVMLIISHIVGTVVGYFPGLLNKAVLNLLQRNAPYKNVILLIAVTVPILIFIKVIDATISILTVKHENEFNQYINNEILEKNAKLDISCYDTPKYYNTISDLTRSKRAFGRFNTQAMRFLSSAIMLCINIVVVSYYSSLTYVVLMFAFIAPSAVLARKYETEMNFYEVNNRNTMRRMSYYAEVMTRKNSAQEIRFYDLKDFFIKKYEDISNEYRNGIKTINKKFGIINSLARVIPYIGTCIVLIISSIDVIQGNMMIGDFVFLISSVSSLQIHFSQIAINLSTSDVHCHAIEKYEDYLSLPEILNTGNIILDKIDSIEFRNVSFKYPYSDEVVLDHVAFKIKPELRTALVGVNGAGKTTIVKLLLRFYDASEGEILINGININQYELVSLRKLIASVFQNYSIYSLPLGFNLTLLFNYDSFKEDMNKAMCNAGMKDFLQSIDYDYDIELSKRFSNDGVVLSGGQNQRIAIARSLYTDAQYYILDEPSAALDPIAEAQIIKAFDGAYKERGLLMITHRLSNTETMDEIIVIENGKIVEIGSHHELIKKEGRYYNLIELQRK